MDDAMLLDLAALQAETKNLLNQAKTAAKKRSQKQPVFSVNTAKKGFDKDAKKKKKKMEMSMSLDLDKTRDLYTNSNRVTVEVLDDASPDNTPRLDIYQGNKESKREQAMKNQKAHEKLLQSEEHFRHQKFGEERTRVLTNNDVFVPAPGVSAEDVERERERLQELQKTAQIRQNESSKDIFNRKTFLAKDFSAVKIQALFRGCLGRKTVALTRRLREMNGDGAAPVQEWIEVRDKESGDVWYYNTVNGISQWEKPEAMMGLLPKNKKLPNIGEKTSKKKKKQLENTQSLPNIHTPIKTKTNGAPTKTKSKRFEDEDKQEELDPYERAQAEFELNEALGGGGFTAVDNLLGPDGFFKPNLKSTIQSALAETRFDSISSVMADKRWMEEDGDGHKGPARKKRAPKVDKSRPQMVSVVTFKKKKEQGAGVTLDEEGLAETKQDGVKDMTLMSVDHPGFEAPATDGKIPDNMCFGCWSAGSTKACMLHEDPNRVTSKHQTMLLCRNWELGVMRRRYRSEEIQEMFMKKASSLRYDSQRKKFVSVVEQRHPIYRAINYILAGYNKKAQLAMRVMRWMQSFAEEIRMGVVKPHRTAEKARILRLKRSLSQWTEVVNYTKNNLEGLPIAPTTGYSWWERIDREQYLFDHPDQALGVEVKLIVAPPHPTPVALYELKKFHNPAPKSIPMPRPEYSDESRTKLSGNKYIDNIHKAAWLEQIASSAMRESTLNAISLVQTITPNTVVQLQQRTKYPVPTSVKFATLGRKPVPGLLARGGLCMELLISQLITTHFPAQYGNFMVMDKSTISPGLSPEVTISFQSIPMAPILQLYKARHLEHPLNYRRSPTITINSKAKLDELWMYGQNRPEQTGESESHGFRTTAWARHLQTHVVTNPAAFTPGADVVSLNITASNKPFTTHADHTYPFCEPSTRDNTTLDFYHLLLTGVHSSSKAQIFTAVTAQDPGDFQRLSDTSKPMGHLLVVVYRSWAFMQRHKIQEFKSDDGVPYWYNRDTGQTYWEKPLVEEEEVSPLLGGSQLDPDHDEEPFMMHRGTPDQIRKHNQGEFRKNQLVHHETDKEAISRRKAASSSAKIARKKGQLPDLIEGVSKVASLSNADEDMEDALPPSETLALNHNPGNQDPNQIYMEEQSVGAMSSANMSTESALISHNLPKNENSKSQSTTNVPGQHNSKVSNGNNNVETGTANMDNNSIFSEIDDGQNKSFMDNQSAFSNDGPSVMTGLDPDMMNKMANTLGQMMANMDMRNAKPQDMIQLGLGMGMAMMNNPQASVGASMSMSREPSVASNSQVQTQGFAESFMNFEGASKLEKSVDTFNVKDQNYKEPIGVPNPSEGQETMEAKMLNHSEEKKQAEHFNEQQEIPLTALENALELKKVITNTPDELTPDAVADQLPGNADEAVKKDYPVMVYPELTSYPEGGPPPAFTSHPPAGIGTSFVLKKDAKDEIFVKGADMLRRATTALPIGFFENIEAKRVAKQIVDYLPHVPNLPQTSTIGRVKPRSAAIDWVAIGFDPWSAGKRPLNFEFVPTLKSKAEQLFDAEKLGKMKKAAEDGAISTVDNEGITNQKIEVTKQQKLAEDFKKVCSLCRHGKFGDIEEMMNHPDWSLSMDYQDDTGNSLLHIAAQNGNKRMVKLCLRRGADLNAQNLQGQTPLHFTYSYGYAEVGEYLVQKGADDSIRNKDGLTCYEGLSAETVENI
mmetsp:Transcript_21852/g.36825  ORF Transcript_21852/g.36825 Transcript_21852/m.36825 type:complete len:1703 (+) Transcript_21852:133-5241(+)|eukprot:CAMPEP_0114426442 /NCGR_PEP_ID=MMETSP0103-20121206/7802_1 /TAXON_ID=37642 ORGANISM="Paraphysomonas imperforata, Strain PA2" /NCGR_SAMPLE_ID=MMETSP0103 /ASSEMBLY_ACC=CAM_ASM_000201 /LENGTH=1702 /DNA_ID=CAMNT_0001595407 /DNA_START=114 /DNA_END=5222 /DNA_ORIENTATION=+